jgi:hypothetical protein
MRAMTRTNTFTLLCVAIRVFALWLAMGLVLMLPGLAVGMQGMADGGLSPWLLGIPLVAGLLVAAVLWLFAEKLARLALASPDEHVFESDLDASTWLGIGLSLLGAWYFFGALIDGAGLLVRALQVAQMREQFSGMEAPPGFGSEVAGTSLQALLGIVLLLRGRGLAALLHRLRYAGYRGESVGE